jgi:hypothetical protein
MSGSHTPSLVEQREALERATKGHIDALLAEDKKIHEDTAARHVAIMAELKQLGWKRPRAAKEATGGQQQG